jgi:hypothetical protein
MLGVSPAVVRLLGFEKALPVAEIDVIVAVRVAAEGQQRRATRFRQRGVRILNGGVVGDGVQLAESAGEDVLIVDVDRIRLDQATTLVPPRTRVDRRE